MALKKATVKHVITAFYEIEFDTEEIDPDDGEEGETNLIYQIAGNTALADAVSAEDDYDIVKVEEAS